MLEQRLYLAQLYDIYGPLLTDKQQRCLEMHLLEDFSMYLFKEKKNFWITAVPATFMSAVSCTYFVLAPECLGKMINTYADGKLVAYNTAVAYPIGIVFAIAMLALFLHATKKHSASKA